MPVLIMPTNNFLGQVSGGVSEGKYNTVNNTTPGEVTFQKCLNSGITFIQVKTTNHTHLPLVPARAHMKPGMVAA